ncbi:MAG: mandelate racemase/muconate lactonizing enzyme family protein [Planctomycetota bacterium]|nr:mandelate racemase/muconate lactonizing enzyme family protein [Planctomycetota bacterium]MDA1211214.1 mandelate racemase/muconate lactonizing enzyme family protein [Planctomycetota bacterium]
MKPIEKTAPALNRRRFGEQLALGATAWWGMQASLGAEAQEKAKDLDADVARKLDLKITKVEVFSLKTKLSRAHGASVSVPLETHRVTLLVKISTDAGISGWGETAPIGGARGALVDSLGPALIGKNPMMHRNLWRDLWGANFEEPCAIGAIDVALADIRGKVLGVSITDLYGGRYRDKVPAYASAMNYVEGAVPEEFYPEDAQERIEFGFRNLKMRLGRNGPDRDAKIAAIVRDTVGPDIRLMTDVNAAYTLHDSLKLGDALGELDFYFYEEPMPQSPDYVDYEELTAKSTIAIAGGEALQSRHAAKRMIDRRCVNIIQPDISLCGGIGEVLFIAEMAALSGIRCIPHCWGAAVLIAATAHAVSMIADPHIGYPTDTPMLEFDQSENPWRTEIVADPFTVDEGFVTVPTGPGLGIEVLEDVVRKYSERVDG